MKFPILTPEQFLEWEHKDGIACDIDETLAWTVRDWVYHLSMQFGNPDNLSPEDAVLKYGHSSFFPAYWQTPECKQWMQERIMDNEFQKWITPVPWAQEMTESVRNRIAVYITIRPEIVGTWTQEYLTSNGFPNAPIILRPDTIVHSDGNKWKAEILHMLHPKIRWIVDDNRKLVHHLLPEYQWKVYVFWYSGNEYNDHPNAIACKDWETTCSYIEQHDII